MVKRWYVSLVLSACGTMGGGAPDAGRDDWSCGGACDCVASIAAGGAHACAAKLDGTVWCWGDNDDGQLGDGTTTTRTTPAQVLGLTDVVEVTAGRAHTCALRAGGTVACWGRNADGELDDGTRIDRTAPVETQLGAVATQVVAGNGATCAIRNDTTVRCWGRVGLGIGDVQIAGVGRLDGATQVAVGHGHACALRTDGSVWCWGTNWNGEFGAAQPTSTILAVRSGFAPAASIAADDLHSCVRDELGAVYCSGFTGLGPDFYGEAPLRIGLAGSAIAITSGQQHDCAIDSAGRAACWGIGNDGRLGNGSEVSQTSPVFVEIVDTTQLAAGGGFTCALDGGGRVRCWGANYDGQLGVGTTASVATPLSTHMTCP